MDGEEALFKVPIKPTRTDPFPTKGPFDRTKYDLLVKSKRSEAPYALSSVVLPSGKASRSFHAGREVAAVLVTTRTAPNDPL